MKKKIIWMVVSFLLVLALLAAACGGEEEEAPVTEKPAVEEEAAPAEKEAAPAEGVETVKVTLTKLDGTTMEKVVEKPQYGGRLTVSQSSDLFAWDEAIQAPWTTSRWLSQTQEDLLIGDWYRGGAGTAEMDWAYNEWTSLDFAAGALAESWEFPEPGTIILHIRQGVKWHDKPPVNGREFTADDAVFNIKRIYFDLPTATMYGMVGDGRPTEVYATDKYTVVMKAPPRLFGNTFEEVGMLTKMVPPEVVAQYGDMNQWENVIGTGPFILTDYVPMSSATWVRNPDYWQHDPILGEDYPLPYLDGIKMLVIPDLSTQMSALRTGKADMSFEWWGYSKEDADQLLASNPELQSMRLEPTGCAPLGFRIDKPELPFDDIRVRRALLMAVNEQEIADTYFQGDAAILNYKVAPVPPYINAGWYTPLDELPESTRELFEYHPDKARELLAEAGYPDGFKTEVVVIPSPAYQDLATMAQGYWSKIGVDLALDIKEMGTFYSIYQKKTHKEGLLCGRSQMVRSMYLCRKGNMYNWAMVDDPMIDDYYYPEVTAAFFDEPKRDALMKEMNLYVLDKAWYWTPPRPAAYYLWQPWMKNFHGFSLGVYRGGNFTYYTWIDRDLKKSLGY